MNVLISDYPLLFCLYPFVCHLHFPSKTTTRVYKTHVKDFDIRVLKLNVNYLSRSGVMS